MLSANISSTLSPYCADQVQKMASVSSPSRMAARLDRKYTTLYSCFFLLTKESFWLRYTFANVRIVVLALR